MNILGVQVELVRVVDDLRHENRQLEEAVKEKQRELRELRMAELKIHRQAMIGMMSFAQPSRLPGSVPFYPF